MMTIQLFWHVLYWLASQPWLVNTIAYFISHTHRFLGEKTARRLTKFLAFLLTAAIPFPPIGYDVLHTSRLYWQLHRRWYQSKPIPKNPHVSPTDRPLRVGIFGTLIGKAPRSLYKAIPPQMEVFVFDLLNPKIGYHARWLKLLVQQYRPLALQKAPPQDVLIKGDVHPDYQPIIKETAVPESRLIHQAAEAINQAQLDVLIILGQERTPQAYQLVDLINTPCIAHFCNSSDIFHHEKIDFYLYTQPEAGYYVKGQRLFCAATQAPFTQKVVYPSELYYDPRTLDLEAPISTWAEREPLIIFHGPLYKLANSPVLETICTLLQKDTALEFVFMGRTGPQDWELAKIETTAKRYGVQARTQYAGYFLSWWDKTGTKVGPDWDKIVNYLQRARLEPNPYPIGGGQARFQAYSFGLPTVHMGVRFNIKRGWLKQPGWVEVPALQVPMGTAYSQEEYIELCRRCLYEETFANQLSNEQRAVARRVSNSSNYWQQILTAYRDWMSHHT